MSLRKAHHRLTGRANDSGSLALAMLLVLVGISLAALMTPTMLRQVTGARDAMNWARALAAAETGLHAALSHVRASNGDIGELPCGPISGDVNPPGPARYRVSIDYLNADPTGSVGKNYLTSESDDDAWVVSHRVSCTGSGTLSTPFYALFRSVGTDVATGSITDVPNRAVWATHKIATTNANIPGGQIRTFVAANQLCFDAGSAQPMVGTTVTAQSCTGGEKQTWAYRRNLTIMLVSTESSTPLCLDAGTPHAVAPVRPVVTLQPCGTTTKPQQQWSFNEWANFEGTGDGATLDGYCLNVETPVVPGSRLMLGSLAESRCRVTANERLSFVPDSAVGAGAAPAVANGQTQLVNYLLFGMCMDIPGEDPHYNFVMAWTCKQRPGGDIEWNQAWTMPTPSGTNVSARGEISTTCNNTPEMAWKCTNGVRYCLKSPLTSAAGTFVTAVPCSDGPTGLTWTRYGANALTYEQRFQVIDANGLCLTVSNESEELWFGTARKLAVRACDGSTLQKWNANPNTDSGLPLTNVGER